MLLFSCLGVGLWPLPSLQGDADPSWPLPHMTQWLRWLLLLTAAQTGNEDVGWLHGLCLECGSALISLSVFIRLPGKTWMQTKDKISKLQPSMCQVVFSGTASAQNIKQNWPSACIIFNGAKLPIKYILVPIQYCNTTIHGSTKAWSVRLLCSIFNLGWKNQSQILNPTPLM